MKHLPSPINIGISLRSTSVFCLLSSILLLLISFQTSAQNKYTISGYVKDEKTGEPLIGATIIIKEITATGTSTNAYGFYSITIPEGNYTVATQFMGYEQKTQSVSLKQNTKLNFDITEKIQQLNEVLITDEKKNENISKPQMGVERINIQEIKNIPVFLGEKDILKTIQLLPGIKSAGEGNTGFYVRGGGADQNLILLDEATVYSPSHLLGFFSVFNSDAIKDVTIFKGGIPAEYGGRLSSVLDIKTNDGNNKKFGVTGGIGLIASRLTVEGPIIKNKGSFMISGRRTYADLFLKLSKDTMINRAQLYFYDLNLKANYQFGEKDRIFLSGYFGRDNFGLNRSNRNVGIDWGNGTGTLRWNHLFSDKLFLNSSFIYTNYNYRITLGAGDTEFQIKSGIEDFSIKEDFQYYISTKHLLKFGGNIISHNFNPGEVNIGTASASGPVQLSRTIENKHAVENAIYISDEFELSKRIKINYGLRYSFFSPIGPANVYVYNADGVTVDSAYYSKNQIIKTYSGPEPRLSAAFVLNESNSIKVSYNRMYQYVQLLSNTTSETPVDLWVPSSTVVKPQLADQVALGYFKNFKENKYESSVEIYYKNMQNQIDYRPGADLRFNKAVESQLLFGRGYAYGAEFFLKKKYGKLNGWIGYTIARSLRQFDEIQATPYPAKQDIIHDVSIVGIYELNLRWTFSATWVYNTGSAVSFPSGKYGLDGWVAKLYTERNGYRMPPYHRMDVGVTWQKTKTDKFESSWNFSVYNVYARENAYSISFQKDPNDPTKTQAIQLSLFRFIPGVTYNFKF